MSHRSCLLTVLVLIVGSVGGARADAPATPTAAATQVIRLAGPRGEILITSDASSRWVRVGWPGRCGAGDPRALLVTTTSSTGAKRTRPLAVEAIAPLPTAAGRAACAGWVHLSTDGIRTTDQATLALDDLPVPTAEAEVLVTTKRPSLMPADVSGTAGAMGWRVQTWPRGMLRTHQLQLFLTPRRDVGVVKAITLIAGDVEARALTSGMRPTKAAIVDDITARRLAAAKDLVVQFDGGKRYTLRPNPLQAALAAHDAAATAMPAPPSDQPPLSSPSDADVATVLVPVFDDGRR